MTLTQNSLWYLSAFGKSTEETVVLWYHDVIWHLTGGPPNTQEKVGVGCAGLRPLLQLLSNLSILSSSYYPCLIQSLSLVTGIIMIYTQGYICVLETERAACVCVCMFSSKQCTVPFLCMLLRHYNNNVFPHLWLWVCIGGIPLHLPTIIEILSAFSNILRNVTSRLLIKFWYVKISLLQHRRAALLLSISYSVLVLLCVMPTVTWKDATFGRSR